MDGINKVILVGRVGAEPRISSTGGGEQMADVSLATSKKYYDDLSNTYKQKVTWLDVRFNDKLARVVEQYVSKGDPIYVEGAIDIEVHKGADGRRRKYYKILGLKLQMLRGAKPVSDIDRQQREQAIADELDYKRATGR